MTPNRILGIVLVIAGIAALVVGLNSSHSLADRVSNTFTGRFTEATTWYIVGGITSAVVGGLVLLLGWRGKGR